jgi:hypothetical protein
LTFASGSPVAGIAKLGDRRHGTSGDAPASLLHRTLVGKHAVQRVQRQFPAVLLVQRSLDRAVRGRRAVIS